ncbi:MAG: hypothetical protein IH804_03525 [Planctomycetes bacterium]|nr:hypothetical protein [Planctomycetota bacterium]
MSGPHLSNARAVATALSVLLVALRGPAAVGATEDPLSAASTQPASRPAAAPGEADPNPPAPGFDRAGSDDRAIEIADAVMKKMGGRRAWDETRYLRWRFFGRRLHVWDRHTSRIRVEGTDRDSGKPYVIVMSLRTGDGRVFKGGEAVTDPDEVRPMLEAGKAAWINDSYWLLMPYKLKDSGVTLRLRNPVQKGKRVFDLLELTFQDVGVTPQNRYEVLVSRDRCLVEMWSYFVNAGDSTPAFSHVWGDWRFYGGIQLSGVRGEQRLTDIFVLSEPRPGMLDRPRGL